MALLTPGLPHHGLPPLQVHHTLQRGRTPRTCHECKGTIAPRETSTHIRYRLGGTWHSHHRCEDCTHTLCTIGGIIKADHLLTTAHVTYTWGSLGRDIVAAMAASPASHDRLLPVIAAWNAAALGRRGLPVIVPPRPQP